MDGIVIDVLLILNYERGPALSCAVEWPAAPRIGDHVKLPTHAENTFSPNVLDPATLESTGQPP